jgi:hypothetical protein
MRLQAGYFDPLLAYYAANALLSARSMTSP